LGIIDDIIKGLPENSNLRDRVRVLGDENESLKTENAILKDEKRKLEGEVVRLKDEIKRLTHTDDLEEAEIAESEGVQRHPLAPRNNWS
jgi:predicted nuclease with TOPRIM domain